VTAVLVQLPPVLRAVTGGARVLEAQGGTVGEVLENLAAQCPALALHLFDENRSIRRNIICIHNDGIVRAKDMNAHTVAAGDELLLANALAGG
jgi:molybdopterin synthase sulfur carrier subunit